MKILIIDITDELITLDLDDALHNDYEVKFIDKRIPIIINNEQCKLCIDLDINMFESGTFDRDTNSYKTTECSIYIINYNIDILDSFGELMNIRCEFDKYDVKTNFENQRLS